MSQHAENSVQTINPGESAIFTIDVVPCTRGFVRHRPGSGDFVLAGKVLRNRCGCFPPSANYSVDFGCNMAIPTGGTVGPISIAYALNGTTIPDSQMIVTPAAVEEYNAVSKEVVVPVWAGCCQTFSVRNTSNQPIEIQNAVINFNRPDLAVTR